ncbi:hypothetical protein [Nannocystis pusilla]|uniref:hypothetical protein n=1 Tax=Nannocystis pusilla TaxID=889268 RepID=UPI003B79C315
MGRADAKRSCAFGVNPGFPLMNSSAGNSACCVFFGSSAAGSATASPVGLSPDGVV